MRYPSLLLPWLCCAVAAQSQAPQRQVQIPLASPNDPVVITRVLVGNVKVQSGRFLKPRVRNAGQPQITPFEAGDDWIPNLSFYLLNRTTQTVAAVHINIGFLDTATPTEPPRACVLQLGRIPEPAAFVNTGAVWPQPAGRLPLSFLPGQSMRIALADHLEEFRPFIEAVMPLAEVSSVRIDLTASYFPDGTRFAGGGYSAPDPDHHGRWRGKGVNYDPGFLPWAWPGEPGWPDP
jgi:hypothetical protein